MEAATTRSVGTGRVPVTRVARPLVTDTGATRQPKTAALASLAPAQRARRRLLFPPAPPDAFRHTPPLPSPACGSGRRRPWRLPSSLMCLRASPGPIQAANRLRLQSTPLAAPRPTVTVRRQVGPPRAPLVVALPRTGAKGVARPLLRGPLPRLQAPIVRPELNMFPPRVGATRPLNLPRP